MNLKTIMIVDDSDFDRELLLKALLRKGNFKIIEAGSGEQCLELLKTQKVDIILMDIMMPGEFGTQILIKIRERFNPIELPIIMVTAMADASDVIGCFHIGANDYITKPVNFDIAISRISTHLLLSDVSREMTRLKELEALNAMITTYNHEINNPLTIALGSINEDISINQKNIDTLRKSLWRIAEIVKKIREVTEKKIEYESYTGTSKMVKIK